MHEKIKKKKRLFFCVCSFFWAIKGMPPPILKKRGFGKPLQAETEQEDDTKNSKYKTSHKNQSNSQGNRQDKKSRKKKQTEHEMRRQRLTLSERKILAKLAFELLDPCHTGKVEKKKLDDIRAEVDYLIRTCKEESKREAQRFVSEFGDDVVHEAANEEAKAYKESIDLENDSESVEEETDSDLEDFIVSDTELPDVEEVPEQLQLTFIPDPPPSKRKKKNIIVDDPD